MILQRLYILALIFIFTACSTGYENDGNAVYYKHWNEGSGQHKERINADPKTFKILKFDNYAKDDKAVFYQGEKIIGADAKSFEALGDYYARDKSCGWHGKDRVKHSTGRTFKVINDYYSTDGKDYFYQTEALNTGSPQSFKFVYGEGDDQCWTTDGKYYYYNSYKVPSEDYKNLKIYPKSGGISNDRYWAYFLDHKLNYDIDGKRVIDTVDIATFRVTGFTQCRDKYGCFNVYHGREKCNN
jgi:hypothetical protein